MKAFFFFRNIIFQTFIFISIFIIADLTYSYFNNKSKQKDYDPNAGLHKQNRFGFYWLDSSINKGNYTFGSINFPIYTNEYGFRCNKSKSITKDSIGYVFLGDSFTYGEGEWEESFVGIFEQKQKVQLFNCGVPSYSPSVYLYQYKKALFTGKLKAKHKIFICLDISDVQDESSRWFYPDSILSNKDKNGIIFPVLMNEAIQKRKREEHLLKNVKSKKITSIKEFVSSNMLLTSYIYVEIKKKLFRDDLIKARDASFSSNIFLNRSGITHIPWKQLDTAKEMGYQPIGVMGGIQKIEQRIEDINFLAKENNAEVYIVIYPWPAQLLTPQSIFSWENHWKSFAAKKGLKFINCFDVFRQEMNKGIKPIAFYIDQDIHFNKYGNELVANAIINQLE